MPSSLEFWRTLEDLACTVGPFREIWSALVVELDVRCVRWKQQRCWYPTIGANKAPQFTADHTHSCISIPHSLRMRGKTHYRVLSPSMFISLWKISPQKSVIFKSLRCCEGDFPECLSRNIAFALKLRVDDFTAPWIDFDCSGHGNRSHENNSPWPWSKLYKWSSQPMPWLHRWVWNHGDVMRNSRVFSGFFPHILIRLLKNVAWESCWWLRGIHVMQLLLIFQSVSMSIPSKMVAFPLSY